MLFRPPKKDVSPGERALWGELMGLGLLFPIAIVLGFFLGRWIGGYFGHPEAGQWIGLVWGVATAFWELFKVTMHLDRMDKEQLPGQDKEKRTTRKDTDGP